jgi:hypothetical protein
MSQRGGYTILEVLIFIGVSSAIFFSAMTAIGGRQEQVQFAQAVREFDAKIRDILNDVTTGYFPTNQTISCGIDPVQKRPRILVDTNAELGTNDDCIYIGKAVQFAPEGDAERINIFTIAGLRYEDKVEFITASSIASSRPTAVARITADPSFHDATEQYDLLYGLKVTRVARPAVSAVDYGVVGIFSQFGVGGISDAQSVQVGGIVGSSFDTTKNEAVNLINTITDDSGDAGDDGYIEKNTNEGIVVCLENADGSRKASVAFGARGSAVTTLNIDTYNKDVCDA